MNILKINFGSNIGRTEYWARLAMANVFFILGIGLFFAISSYFGDDETYVSLGGAVFILLYAMVIYAVVYSWNNYLGRLRDAKKRPYVWMFFAFAPGINIIIFIILGCFQTPDNEVPASVKDKIVVVVSFIFWLLSILVLTGLRTLIQN